MSSRNAIMNQIAARVYNKMTVKRVTRIRMLNQTIAEGVESPFNLLTCDDDPNYDLATDGTNVGEVEPGSRIIAVQLHCTVFNVPSAARLIEWVIGKDPDGMITAANFTMANLYTQDATVTNLQLRKNIWAAGHLVGLDRLGGTVSINIPGSSLARAGRMEDGDAIRINFTDDGTGTGGCGFYLRGRIITRGP